MLYTIRYSSLDGAAMGTFMAIGRNSDASLWTTSDLLALSPHVDSQVWPTSHTPALVVFGRMWLFVAPLATLEWAIAID